MSVGTTRATVGCEAFEASVVTEYMELALTQEDEDRVRLHLVGCPRCARLLHELQTTVDLLGSLRSIG
jgi:hypothetical protein